MNLRNRFRGALVGTLVGDALGARFEGHLGPVPETELARVENDGSPLHYTDDTAMTFAVAESLLCCGGLDLDHLALSLAAVYEREPQRGYGAGAVNVLSQVRVGCDWRKASAALFARQGSFGNGAAMRVAPVAIHVGRATDEVVQLGRASATVTHTHPEAIDAAGIQAAAVALAVSAATEEALSRPWLLHELWKRAQTRQLRAALDAVSELPADSSPVDVAAATGTGVSAAQAVPAAVAAAVLRGTSFADTIRFTISMGGDTDTIAAMAAIPTPSPPWRERSSAPASAKALSPRSGSGAWKASLQLES